MADLLHVAVVGLVHDHIWGTLDPLCEDGRAVLVAAADDNEGLRRRVVEEYGARNAYAGVADLLDRETVDALVCASGTHRPAVWGEAAAAGGLHMVGEKAMAATYAQARRMVEAAERGNIMLMINWPTAWNRGIVLALALVQEGRIGQPFYVKYHAGHSGPREIGCSESFGRWLYDAEKTGPGALMDYCCYGANLSCTLLGKPQSVTGAGGRFVKEYDIPLDNAILLLQYARAVGVAEASWTQVGHPPHYELVVMGSAGSIVTSPGGDAVTLVTREAPNGRRVEAPALPKGRHNEAAYFLSCILEGTPPAGMVGPQACCDAQEVLEAGAHAIAEQRVVPLE